MDQPGGYLAQDRQESPRVGGGQVPQGDAVHGLGDQRRVLAAVVQRGGRHGQMPGEGLQTGVLPFGEGPAATGLDHDRARGRAGGEHRRAARPQLGQRPVGGGVGGRGGVAVLRDLPVRGGHLVADAVDGGCDLVGQRQWSGTLGQQRGVQHTGVQHRPARLVVLARVQQPDPAASLGQQRGIEGVAGVRAAGAAAVQDGAQRPPGQAVAGVRGRQRAGGAGAVDHQQAAVGTRGDGGAVGGVRVRGAGRAGGDDDAVALPDDAVGGGGQVDAPVVAVASGVPHPPGAAAV